MPAAAMNASPTSLLSIHPTRPAGRHLPVLVTHNAPRMASSIQMATTQRHIQFRITRKSVPVSLALLQRPLQLLSSHTLPTSRRVQPPLPRQIHTLRPSTSRASLWPLMQTHRLRTTTLQRRTIVSRTQPLLQQGHQSLTFHTSQPLSYPLTRNTLRISSTATRPYARLV
jgi:hypothetical protein